MPVQHPLPELCPPATQPYKNVMLACQLPLLLVDCGCVLCIRYDTSRVCEVRPGPQYWRCAHPWKYVIPVQRQYMGNSRERVPRGRAHTCVTFKQYPRVVVQLLCIELVGSTHCTQMLLEQRDITLKPVS
jgi:hypothetical protein